LYSTPSSVPGSALLLLLRTTLLRTTLLVLVVLLVRGDALGDLKVVAAAVAWLLPLAGEDDCGCKRSPVMLVRAWAWLPERADPVRPPPPPLLLLPPPGAAAAPPPGDAAPPLEEEEEEEGLCGAGGVQEGSNPDTVAMYFTAACCLVKPSQSCHTC
jgi:hypothetical protein